MAPTARLPPKKDVALALLEQASMYVHLDPRGESVQVPPWFKKQPQLVLQVGLNMAVQIPDLHVDDNGLSCTLSFNRSPFFCMIPWPAVFALVGENGQAMVWAEDVPAEVSAQAQAQKAPPPKPRAHLRSVGEGESAPAPAAEAAPSEREKKAAEKKAQPAIDAGAEVLPTVVKKPGKSKAKSPTKTAKPAAAAKTPAKKPVAPKGAQKAPEPAPKAEPAAQAAPAKKSSQPKAEPARSASEINKPKRELPPYLRVVK